MNNNQEMPMCNNNYALCGNNTGLNAEDFVLLMAAQAGDKNACGKLYLHHAQEVERMHLYGPDGKHPKKFGFGQSRKGASYEEASGYCYICFYNCVNSYKLGSGIPFMAWVRTVFAKRGLDWVAERNPDGFLQEGDLITENGEDVKEDYSSLPEAFTEGRFVSATDFENASEDVFRMRYSGNVKSEEETILDEEGLEQVRRFLHKEGNKKLEQFVETYIQQGVSQKNPMTAVAEQMGVRRQTAYNYLDAVQNLVKGHFGNHFYGRD